MERRRFIIAALGGVALLPVTARGQEAIPLIGFVHSGSADQNTERLNAYLRGLKDAGFTPGQNVRMEFHWANGDDRKIPGMIADLATRSVTLIVTAGSTSAGLMAKAATNTIPIVFSTGGDPVAMGLVNSLNHPGGNATGITSSNANVSAKRLELLHQLVPEAKYYFALVNPGSALTKPFVDDLRDGTAKLGIDLEILKASDESEIDRAFESMPAGPGNALLSCPDAYLYSRRAQIVRLAARYQIPTAFDVRDYVDAGGLISYGTDYLDVMRLAGVYTGRILKGENPAEIPVMRADKFELVINLNTAKSLGITVSSNLLALADDVVDK